jgi:L-lysine exporter family protein LysE/ArgO
MDFSVYAAGLTMGLSLIVAIGAQNAFVLRQGLRREHVFTVCLTCAASDAILITVGVSSFRQVSDLLPWLDPAMRYGGAAFLIWYGLRSLRSAFRSEGALVVGEARGESLRHVLITPSCCSALSRHSFPETDSHLPWARQQVRCCFSFPWATVPAGFARSSPTQYRGAFWKR